MSMIKGVPGAVGIMALVGGVTVEAGGGTVGMTGSVTSTVLAGAVDAGTVVGASVAGDDSAVVPLVSLVLSLVVSALVSVVTAADGLSSLRVRANTPPPMASTPTMTAAGNQRGRLAVVVCRACAPTTGTGPLPPGGGGGGAGGGGTDGGGGGGGGNALLNTSQVEE